MGMLEDFFKQYGDGFYVIFRVIVGMLLFFHGLQKFGAFGDMDVAGFAGMFGLPFFVAWLVAFVELVGGFGILVGLFTRLSALGGAVIMLGAMIIAHFPQGIYPLGNGSEVAFLNLAAFLVLLVWGAGKWSLEKAVMKKEFF